METSSGKAKKVFTVGAMFPRRKRREPKKRKPASEQQLERIAQNIKRASSTHQELSTTWLNRTPEDLVQKVLDSFEDLKNECFGLQRNLQAEKQATARAHERVRLTQQQAAEELANLRDTYEKRLRSKETEHREEIKKKDEVYKQEILKTSTGYNQQIIQKERQHLQKLMALEADHKQQMAGKESAHQRLLASIEEQRQRLMRDFDNKYFEMKRELVQKYDELLRQSHDQKEAHQLQSHEMVEAHKRLLEDINVENTKMKNELIQNYESLLHQSYQREEEMKQSLSSREHFKSLTDRDMTKRFKKLSMDIEEISRIEWDLDRERNWPCTDNELRLVWPHNVSRLKQHMVQNHVWLTLQEHVFRSPFRIIGPYGEAYDSELYESNNADFDSLGDDECADLNTKRYKNAEFMLGCINSSGSLSEHGERIVDSYIEARTAVLNLLCISLTRVVPLDQGDRKALEIVLHSAASLWLEICSQRYRLFVMIPDDSKDVLSLGIGDFSSLRLVLNPGLQRFGNSRGENIHKGELVAGWESDFQSIQIRTEMPC